jgi:hypothetical protein
MLIGVAVLACLAGSCFAIDTSELSSLLGYTIIAATNAHGDFEGADAGKVIKLGNGWIFEFTSYNYDYAFEPDVIVLARDVSPDEFRKMGVKAPPAPIRFYKLIIEDEIYDVRRVR